MPTPSSSQQALGAAIGAARAAGLLVIYVVVGFRPGQPEISTRNSMFGRLAGATMPAGDEGMQVHPFDFGGLLTTELAVVLSMGRPTEIFEVTRDIIDNWERYALIVSDTVPFAESARALELATTPGAADKVVVTFD